MSHCVHCAQTYIHQLLMSLSYVERWNQGQQENFVQEYHTVKSVKDPVVDKGDLHSTCRGCTHIMRTIMESLSFLPLSFAAIRK